MDFAVVVVGMFVYLMIGVFSGLWSVENGKKAHLFLIGWPAVLVIKAYKQLKELTKE